MSHKNGRAPRGQIRKTRKTIDRVTRYQRRTVARRRRRARRRSRSGVLV